MSKFTYLVSASLLVLAVAAPASAENYYARQSLVKKARTSAPTPTPTPTSPDGSGQGTPNAQGYRWVTGSWGAWQAQYCPQARYRTVECQAANGVVAIYQCQDLPKPADKEENDIWAEDCHAWAAGAWSDYSSECSATATRTRTVFCQRRKPFIQTVEDSWCNASDRLDASETTERYSGCESVVQNGDFQDGNNFWSGNGLRVDDTGTGDYAKIVASDKPLQQALKPMIAGKQYTLSFKMKGRFTSYGVAVRADIISSAGTINVGTLNNTATGPWISGSYTFTAASATNTVKFVTFSSGSMVVDDVVIK